MHQHVIADVSRQSRLYQYHTAVMHLEVLEMMDPGTQSYLSPHLTSLSLDLFLSALSHHAYHVSPTGLDSGRQTRGPHPRR